MRLNTIKPASGSKREHLRVGRGASAGQGKTCGRGVKGQRARKGGYHKVGFEGGQMPLQRRLPKTGFRSAMKASRSELTLSDLAFESAVGGDSRRRLHNGLDLLPHLGIGHPDHRHISDLRMQGQRVLHLLGVDVHPTRDDHEILPIGEVKVTLVIDVPEVPDGVPAVARDDHPGRGRGVIKGGRVGTP